MSNEELLQLKIRAITEGIQQSVNELNGLAGATRAVAPAAQSAGGGTEQLSGKLTTLHEILGSSRRETMLLERTILELTGVTGGLAQGFEALMTGIGPVGLAIAGIGAAVMTMNELWDKQYEKFKDLNDELGKFKEGNRGAIAQLSDMAGVSDRAATSALKFAEGNKASAAELARLTMALENAKAAHLDTGDAQQMQLYADAVSALQASVYKYGDALGAVTPEAAPFKDDLDYIQHAAMTATDALDSLAVALAKNTQARKDTAGAFIEQTPEQGAAAADRAGIEIGVNKALADGKALYDARQKAAADYASELAKIADLNKEIAAASVAATPEIVANFQLIASSTGDASLHMRELQAYISSLPENVRSKIQLAIEFGGNMDLANRLGLGGGGKDAATRDMMKEMEIRFGSQDANTQRQFVGLGGGNKDMAEALWAKTHAAELFVDAQKDPSQFVNLPNAAQSGVGFNLATGVNQSLAQVKPSEPLAAAIEKDRKDISKAGEVMGKVVLKSLSETIEDGAGDVSTAFMKALVGSLDGRYVRRPIGYTTPQ